MSTKAQGAVTTSTAPQTLHRIEFYTQPELPSTPFAGTKGNWLRQRRVKELLDEILLGLHWPTITDSDRATLLLCIDRLERKLIDFRRGG